MLVLHSHDDTTPLGLAVQDDYHSALGRCLQVFGGLLHSDGPSLNSTPIQPAVIQTRYFLWRQNADVLLALNKAINYLVRFLKAVFLSSYKLIFYEYCGRRLEAGMFVMHVISNCSLFFLCTKSHIFMIDR